MNRLRVHARRLTNNWRLKLASLALAVLLWALVRAEQRTEQWVTVRVEPQVLDPGFTIAGRPEPRTVEVRFAGRWREMGELAIERPVLVLHLRNIGRQRTFALDPSMVRLPDDVRGSVTALDVRPSTVRIPLQRATAGRIPLARPRSGEPSAPPDSAAPTPADTASAVPAVEDTASARDSTPSVP